MAQFECFIDRKMSVLPVSELCAYDAGGLGRDGVAELACVHPFVDTGSSQFQLYADRDTYLAISGELDISCADLFATTLERTLPLLDEPEIIIEATDWAFGDHRSLLALDAAAGSCSATIELCSPPPCIRRLAEIVPVDHVRLTRSGPAGEPS